MRVRVKAGSSDKERDVEEEEIKCELPIENYHESTKSFVFLLKQKGELVPPRTISEKIYLNDILLVTVLLRNYNFGCKYLKISFEGLKIFRDNDDIMQ